MNSEGGSTHRRDVLFNLLRLGGLGAGCWAHGLWLSARSRRPEEHQALAVEHHFTVPPDPSLPEVVVVQGEDPGALVSNALNELGGIRRFIGRGDVVVVKPNIA